MNAQYQKGEMGGAAAAILLRVKQQQNSTAAPDFGESFIGAELGAPPTAVKLADLQHRIASAAHAREREERQQQRLHDAQQQHAHRPLYNHDHDSDLSMAAQPYGGRTARGVLFGKGAATNQVT